MVAVTMVEVVTTEMMHRSGITIFSVNNSSMRLWRWRKVVDLIPQTTCRKNLLIIIYRNSTGARLIYDQR